MHPTDCRSDRPRQPARTAAGWTNHWGCAALALSGLLTACSTVGKGPPRPASAVQVNLAEPNLTPSRSDEAPAVIIDTDDPNTAYLAEVELGTGKCRFYVSANRGATWMPEQAPAVEPYATTCGLGSAGPQNLRTELVQDPSGTIYQVFQATAAQDGGGRGILIGRSADKGRTWHTVPIVTAKPPTASGQEVELNFAAHLAIDPANPRRLYAMWRRSYSRFIPARPTRPYMSVSDDGGDTWSPAQQMFDRNTGSDGPRPVVVGSQLWAFWREPTPPTPTNQAEPFAEPPVTRLFASVSTDQGRTWKDHQVASANDASEPVLLYDRGRRTFNVVWHDNRADELDVYFSSSSDGVSWSAPMRLNDDPAGNLRGQHFPQISRSTSGRLDVAWYDWRDDPFPPSTVGNGQTLSLFSNRGQFASVYMTSSRDGGSSWTPNLRVSDELIDRTLGVWANNFDVMAPLAIASSDAGAIVAWSDTRNGNVLSQTQDIYTSTVTFGRPEIRKVTVFQAGVVGGILGAGIMMAVVAIRLRGAGGKRHRPLFSREASASRSPTGRTVERTQARSGPDRMALGAEEAD